MCACTGSDTDVAITLVFLSFKSKTIFIKIILLYLTTYPAEIDIPTMSLYSKSLDNHVQFYICKSARNT
jgi:hypothetical protein